MSDILDIGAYNMGDVMHTDIGLLNLDKQITVPSFAYGPTFNSMSGIQIQGKLDSDKVEIKSQKEKDQKVWNTVFLGAGIAGAVFAFCKFGKTGAKALLGLVKKGAAGAWGSIKKLGSSIKGKFVKPKP